MTGYIVIILKAAAAAAAGFLAGHGAVYVFNRMPAEWLCDYGQTPEDELRDLHIQRIKGFPWKLVFSGMFVCIGINTVLYDWQFAAAAMLFCWAMVIIAAADKKYGIIPDQFVLLAAVSAIGFIPSYGTFMEPVKGLLLGGGVMLLAAVAGRLVFKQDALGFGDVKLFAAIGLAMGGAGTFAVLVMSSLLSAAVFSVMLLRKKIKRTDSLPLGPYICGCAIFYVAIIVPLL